MSSTANDNRYDYDNDEERLRNGIELRYAAQNGDDSFIKKTVEHKANACSSDSFGNIYNILMYYGILLLSLFLQ